jgi:hypothetical protein
MRRFSGSRRQVDGSIVFSLPVVEGKEEVSNAWTDGARVVAVFVIVASSYCTSSSCCCRLAAMGMKFSNSTRGVDMMTVLIWNEYFLKREVAQNDG